MYTPIEWNCITLRKQYLLCPLHDNCLKHFLLWASGLLDSSIRCLNLVILFFVVAIMPLQKCVCVRVCVCVCPAVKSCKVISMTWTGY